MTLFFYAPDLPVESVDVRSNIFFANDTDRKDILNTYSFSDGTVSYSHAVAPLIEQNVFVQHHAREDRHAGVIHVEYSAVPVIRTNWIVGNLASGDRRPIYVSREAEPLIELNLVVGNGTTHGSGRAVRINNGGRAGILNNVLAHASSGEAIRCRSLG